ncbi:MAG: energy transducer TonB [Gammaproteobacteria bacterium]|nr:energy transducer TonB [Gammaproteobacteria bacterium]
MQLDSTRIPMIVFAAIVVNILMFTAIEMMVGMKRVRLTDANNVDIANFIRMAEQSRDVRSRRDPKAPEKPPQEMQKDLRRLNAANNSGLGGMSIDVPDIDFDIGIGSDIAIARELTPLVRVPPEYPISALARGTEGYVILRFTVTESGSVEDPVVLRAEPPRVFNRAALRAVVRFKYQPQFVDGKPVRVKTYTRLTFIMADE